MEDLINEISAIAAQCEEAASIFDRDPIATDCQQLHQAVNTVARSWSGSWLGYQASLYLKDLQLPRAGEFYDSDWGSVDSFLSRTNGNWLSYSYKQIEAAILARARIKNLTYLEDAARHLEEVFEENKQKLLPIFDALLSLDHDKSIEEIRDQLANLQSHLSRMRWLINQRPKNAISRDHVAVAQFLHGCEAPPHLAFQGWLLSIQSHATQTAEIAKIARHLETYLRRKTKLKTVLGFGKKSEPTQRNLNSLFNIIRWGGTHVGDKYELKNNVFQNSNTNIGSQLDGVTQSIGNLATANQEAKQQFMDLVNQLKEVLQTLPANNQDDANKVVRRVEALVAEVEQPKPDEEEIETRGNSLKKAAENLAGVTPTIMGIVGQIITYIPKLLGHS